MNEHLVIQGPTLPSFWSTPLSSWSCNKHAIFIPSYTQNCHSVIITRYWLYHIDLQSIKLLCFIGHSWCLKSMLTWHKGPILALDKVYVDLQEWALCNYLVYSVDITISTSNPCNNTNTSLSHDNKPHHIPNHPDFPLPSHASYWCLSKSQQSFQNRFDHGNTYLLWINSSISYDLHLLLCWLHYPINFPRFWTFSCTIQTPLWAQQPITQGYSLYQHFAKFKQMAPGILNQSNNIPTISSLSVTGFQALDTTTLLFNAL